jgi:hypothetical protein
VDATSGQITGWVTGKKAVSAANVKKRDAGSNKPNGERPIKTTFVAGMSTSNSGGMSVGGTKNAGGPKRPVRYKRRYPR